MSFIFLWLWRWFLALMGLGRRPCRRGKPFIPAPRLADRARKPDRVIDEIVRLKALMADAGCRRIADTFNRLHAARHATTVSKTWVATTVRKHRYEIDERRPQWKRRIPVSMSINRVWGLDLTGKMGRPGVSSPVQ